MRSQQREEIVRAFVAKYGFGPERAIQVEQDCPGGRKWFVREMHEDEVVTAETIRFDGPRRGTMDLSDPTIRRIAEVRMPRHPRECHFLTDLIIDLKLRELGKEHEPITMKRLQQATKAVREISQCYVSHADQIKYGG